MSSLFLGYLKKLQKSPPKSHTCCKVIQLREAADGVGPAIYASGAPF